MPIAPVKGEFSGMVEISLPAKPLMAVRAYSIKSANCPWHLAAFQITGHLNADFSEIRLPVACDSLAPSIISRT